MTSSYYDHPEAQSPNMIVGFDLPHYDGGMYHVRVVDNMTFSPVLKPWTQPSEMILHFYCVCYDLTPCPDKSARIIQLERGNMRKTFHSDAVVKFVDGAYIAVKAVYSVGENIVASPITRAQKDIICLRQ